MKKLLPHRLVPVLTTIMAVSLSVVLISGEAAAKPQISDSGKKPPKKRITVDSFPLQESSPSTNSGFQATQQAAKSKKKNETSQNKVSVGKKLEDKKSNGGQRLGQKPVNNEAIQEIESIRRQLGIAIFPDQEGSSQFKAQVGKLMSEDDSNALSQVIEGQKSLLSPPQVRKATQSDFPSIQKHARQNAVKPTTTGSRPSFSFPPTRIPNNPSPVQQNAGLQIPPRIQMRSNLAPSPVAKAEYTRRNSSPTRAVYGTLAPAPFNGSSKAQQTIEVLYDTVGELDRTALAFERAGEYARADVFRQLSKSLREQIVDTKLMLEDTDKPTIKEGGSLVD